MRHKHADMIIAKAENMDLTVFYFDAEDKEWRRRSFEMMISDETPVSYFLCLHKHKDACLHWLNGGSVQDFFEGEWTDCTDYDGVTDWSCEHMFMLEEAEYRITPKKQKRLIATFPWSGNDFYVTPESFASEDLLNDYIDMYYGKRDLMLVHEIEVEV